MRRGDFMNAVNDILNNVPSAYQLEAMEELMAEYHKAAEEGLRWEELKRVVYTAIHPALVEYSRDKSMSLYEALNVSIAYLRMKKEEVYNDAIVERDANGYADADRQVTAEEE